MDFSCWFIYIFFWFCYFKRFWYHITRDYSCMRVVCVFVFLISRSFKCSQLSYFNLHELIKENFVNNMYSYKAQCWIKAATILAHIGKTLLNLKLKSFDIPSISNVYLPREISWTMTPHKLNRNKKYIKKNNKLASKHLSATKSMIKINFFAHSVIFVQMLPCEVSFYCGEINLLVISFNYSKSSVRGEIILHLKRNYNFKDFQSLIISIKTVIQLQLNCS